MGLFTSKKNLCPICGAPTPRLLATKVEDMPLCKECAGKLDVPNETVQAMTLEGLRQYLAFYEENGALRAQFQNEYTFDVNGWSAEVQIDHTHGLFRLANTKQSIVFEGKCIRSFRILEDNRPLYEGSAAGLRCGLSKAPDYLDQLWPTFNEYLVDRREYERISAMSEIMDREHDRPRRNIPEPRFDVKKPVQHYRLELILDHPYRKDFRGELDGPDFSALSPDLVETIQKYNDVLDALDLLAQNLMQLFAPHAPIQRPDNGGSQAAQAASAPAAPVDTVNELRRFKELLDQGIITEEDFTAKKRQLLGV